ncbi:MAG TPA: hypothetical protein VN673_19440 [Clostridia bacterium]|nr:hypothetical protein [Clostridia bacterium]
MKLFAVWLYVLSICSLGAQTHETLLSRVSVLTIHVSDTNIHDRVFHFLTDVLDLPVDYYPEMLGERRYAAVYAGNMFIEPCGPYSNMRYPRKGFKALFFGLNCNSDKSSSGITTDLQRLNIAHTADSETFRIHDASLAEGIYLAIKSSAQKTRSEAKEVSLQSAMVANSRKGVGFEYVKEIWLGYTGSSDLNAWKQFLGASGRVNDTLWKLSKNQSLRFVRSEFKGVLGIVCKVQSMENAEKYLKEKKSLGRTIDGKIEIDQAQTCGLSILLTEDGR